MGSYFISNGNELRRLNVKMSSMFFILPAFEEGDGFLEPTQVEHADRHVVDHHDVRLRVGPSGRFCPLQSCERRGKVAGGDGEHGGVEQAVHSALAAILSRSCFLGRFEVTLRRFNITCPIRNVSGCGNHAIF